MIYEKIPAIRNDLRQQAEALVLGAETKSPVIAEFYVRQLNVFFAGPQNFWRHLLESRQPLNAVLVELEELRRYLNDQERIVLEKLAQLVRRKEGLDSAAVRFHALCDLTRIGGALWEATGGEVQAA